MSAVSFADGTLVAAYLARVDWHRVFTLNTRRYAPAYLPATAADRMAWPAFADAVPALFRERLDGAALDVMIVPKSVTWSDRDVNVYVGSPSGPPVRSCLDLSEDGFVTVFGWHVALARRLAVGLGCDVYVTHGFNPLDTSPDAHSVGAKFHTHLHIPDVGRRRPAVPSELSHFDRLSLIEPYSVVLWDLVRRFLAEDGAASRWRAEAGFGFVSGSAPLDHRTIDDLYVLSRLLANAHRVYLDVVDVFTVRETERTTGHQRYIPLLRGEREHRLAAFAVDRAGWLSDESLGVLAYLARNLAWARARDTPRSTRITTARQAWMAKGLSGALNFVVPASGARLRFDFAPRIISTSGATKMLSTDPTIIRKDRGAASPADRRRMAGFHRAVVAAANGGWLVPTQRRSSPSISSSLAPPVSSA